MNSEPNISSFMYVGVSELLRQHNICPDSIYQQVGLSPAIETDPSVLLPYSSFLNMLEHLKQVLPYAHPSLMLSKIQHQQGENFYVYLLLNSPNLGVMLQNALQYRKHFSEITYWDWHTDDDYLFIKRSSFSSIEYNVAEHSLYSLSYSFHVIKKVINDNNDNIEYVSLIKPKCEGQQELMRYFNCPIRYEQDFDGVVLKRRALLTPNDHFCHKKYGALLKRMIDLAVIFPSNQTFESSVKALIFSTLTTDFCTIEGVAKMMNIHHRTLQNRLRKEGTTFKKAVQQVRDACAVRMLMQQELSLSKISRLLGYSELSAFTRAFTATHEMSPKVWRKLRLSA